tara:strand:+ start:263 stop:568 length:306 start_codon:yes stop_codon:yes gene_type:complete
MAEEVQKPKPKKPAFEYKILGHNDKLGLILETLLELETALFSHNMNMLDEKHSEYPQWKATNDEIVSEINRLRYVYERMGGGWENFDESAEPEYNEYGEEV